MKERQFIYRSSILARCCSSVMATLRKGTASLLATHWKRPWILSSPLTVIKGQGFGNPLAENREYRMSIGIGGSLSEALQMATSGMMRWLNRDYKLSASESGMVMGFVMKYDVVDLVGTQVSIAAKLPKTALEKLTKFERLH